MRQQEISPGFQLRVQYMRSKPLRPNTFELQYFTKFKSLGIKTFQGLYPAYFTLKNGLQYTGMATSNQISSGATLVTVPETMILSSITALKQPKLKSVFEQPFYNQKDSWEGRVLITYMMFLNKTKPADNIFVEMISHMPKEIDLAFIWSQEQLNLLIDKTLKKIIESDIQQFEIQWRQFEVVQRKHQIIQSQEFNKSNYLWLYIHGETRTFSSKIKYLSYVPLCQFFNHHSCSVYYDTNMVKQEKQKIINLVSQKDYENQSSDGSNESQLQNLCEDQFSYHQVQWREQQIQECGNSLQEDERQEILELSISLLQKIEKKLDWKDFTIIFVGNIFNSVEQFRKDYLMGKTGYGLTIDRLNMLENALQKYLQMIKSFYRSKFGEKFIYKAENAQQGKQTKEEFIRPDPSNSFSSFTQFYLKNSNKDNIPSDNQIYFRYGKKSNRYLLLRYGFAIEGNKYEHVWLSFCLKDQLKQFVGLEQRFLSLGLSLQRKFKISYCSLNLSLIIFFRLKTWSLTNLSSIESIFYVDNLPREMGVLSQIKDFLIQQLEPYKDILQSDLTNPKLGYHEYFICVFNLEKKRIIERQILLLEKLVKILDSLQQGVSLEKAVSQMKGSERFILRPYLQHLKVSRL